ncbi:PREDICTED: uncharacterized protein LOC104778564 [Camelina sativa]|uniref:Uncharacterized protein LOC104778564 n=1 Tax=Camelina sativa TaxID=90675 RepID=A0ABM0YIC6_CAMSA|nr:PREDICTED: uncharacterized protein LOC104778564 [Camelina sativa]
MNEDNKVTTFCKATSACKEAAFYFLERFNWNLQDAISGLLHDQLPPLKDPFPQSQAPRRLKALRYRSRNSLKRRCSATSVSDSKRKMVQDEITIMRSSDTAALATSLDDSRELHDSDGVFHGEKIVSIPNPIIQEFKEEGSSSVTATTICEPTSIEIDLPCSDPDSDSD